MVNTVPRWPGCRSSSRVETLSGGVPLWVFWSNSSPIQKCVVVGFPVIGYVVGVVIQWYLVKSPLPHSPDLPGPPWWVPGLLLPLPFQSWSLGRYALGRFSPPIPAWLWLTSGLLLRSLSVLPCRQLQPAYVLFPALYFLQNRRCCKMNGCGNNVDMVTVVIFYNVCTCDQVMCLWSP